MLKKLFSFGASPRHIQNPSPPDGHRLYVVGDIHGRADLLDVLMRTITQDAASHETKKKEIIFLGDYIDRGVKSKTVLETLSTFTQSFPSLNATPVFLRGNHDDVLLQFCGGNFSMTANWLALGGVSTLASYGINSFSASANRDMELLRTSFLERCPATHIQFLKSTVSACTRGDYFFAHAGIRPNVALARQASKDLMWIRHEFLGYPHPHKKVIVHGHSVFDKPDSQPNRIGIDTGAYATGHLTCLILDGTEQRFITT